MKYQIHMVAFGETQPKSVSPLPQVLDVGEGEEALSRAWSIQQNVLETLSDAKVPVMLFYDVKERTPEQLEKGFRTFILIARDGLMVSLEPVLDPPVFEYEGETD